MLRAAIKPASAAQGLIDLLTEGQRVSSYDKDHELRVVDQNIRPKGDRAEVLLICPSGDLRVRFGIKPASAAQGLIDLLTEGHATSDRREG